MVNESGTDLSDGVTLDYARTMMGELKGDLDVCRDLMARADSALADLEKSVVELAKLENQIKAEEQKTQIPKAKISVMFKNEAVVVLPEHVRLSCGHDNVDGFPSLISLIQITNTVLLRYAYLAHKPNPHTCFIFAVGDDRKPAGNRYHKLFEVVPRFGGEIQHDDVVAAVKLLGFELEG